MLMPINVHVCTRATGIRLLGALIGHVSTCFFPDLRSSLNDRGFHDILRTVSFCPGCDSVLLMSTGDGGVHKPWTRTFL